MSAAAADRDAKKQSGQLKRYPLAASTTIYKGTLVGLNSSGYLVPMSDTASLQFVGVAFDKTDNSAGSNGDKYCRVELEGEFEFAYAGGDAAQTKVGELMYAQDDQTVDEDASLTTNDYPVGFCTEFISTTKVRVLISAHVRSAGTVATGDLANSAVTTAKIANDNVTSAKLTDTLATGFIPLDITTAKIIGSDVIGNTTEGLLPDGNTAPSLQRVNSATDKALRVIWAASSSIEIQLGSFPYPADLDDTAAVEVHLLARMAGATDTPVIAVGYFEGVGDTNAGGNTSALTNAIAEYTVSIAAADIAAHPNFATVTLTPGAHTTDALWLYAAWVEYTRK